VTSDETHRLDLDTSNIDWQIAAVHLQITTGAHRTLPACEYLGERVSQAFVSTFSIIVITKGWILSSQGSAEEARVRRNGNLHMSAQKARLTEHLINAPSVVCPLHDWGT
jgi:hypothetical protein